MLLCIADFCFQIILSIIVIVTFSALLHQVTYCCHHHQFNVMDIHVLVGIEGIASVTTGNSSSRTPRQDDFAGLYQIMSRGWKQNHLSQDCQLFISALICFGVLRSSSSSSAFPGISLGFAFFGWEFCICDHFFNPTKEVITSIFLKGACCVCFCCWNSPV